MVKVSSIEPSAPPQVDGSVTAPRTIVGNEGSESVTSISSIEVHPEAVIDISL